ncbi:formate dehydrogenase subunit alpha [Salinisphaera sp.]|uniref:formate dehydrogenase subunit alpha n=1 Tax=Salinisphaera sp. TaxID=1914330 RepID=UPI002D7876A4|nr:formate dehydrogenase subunit alpha [Salinisphaera sp.]HET7313641.1 formate dehydrogenase subunit alpha [Salinisphaera sp.]
MTNSDDADVARLTVDGREIRGRPGEPLIDCLERNDLYLPHLCYHPGLGPLQSCDTCLVGQDGQLRYGCSLSVADGMKIELAGTAQDARGEAIQRIMAKHELYCTVCENNNGNCEVHDTVRDMQVRQQSYDFKTKPYANDESHPFYRYDPDQCILCGRCVEVCQNVEVNETLSIDWSREHPRVIWDDDRAIDESSCVSCGQCVTVCPCNALMEKDMIGQAGPFTGMPRELKRPMIEIVKAVEPKIGIKPIMDISLMDEALRSAEIKRTKTVCTYCGVGCAFEMWTRDRQILKIQPDHRAPANGISTCIKGKFGWDFVNSDKRLTTPLVRENGSFREASWDEALDRVVEGLRGVAKAHGADAVSFVASSKCTNEESYLMQKLARAVFGTNNIDNCSRYCQNPATAGLFRTVGYGGDAGTIKDLESAEVVLIIGSNTAETHPVIASRMKRAHKLYGQKHIVADPHRQEMAERANIHLRPENSTDLVWVSALSRYMFDHGYADTEFLEQHVHDVEDFRKSLEPFTIDYAAEICDLDPQLLIDAGEMIGQAKTVCGVWAMGVTQHSHGSDTSTAISNLLLVTGNYGKPGTGGYPMRGHNNVQGCSDFGSLFNIFPGYASVFDDEAREHWRAGWNVESLPSSTGLNNHTMVDAMSEGKLKAMYIMGEEMALVDSNSNRVREGFENLGFMVVQDIFMSMTAGYADVVLPGAPSVEKDGTFVNTERRIQRINKVFEPLGEARPDWAITTEIAKRMGHDWGYTHPSEIMAEAASLAPMFAGVNYARLEGWNSLVWPVAPDGTDTPLLYADGRFHFDDGKARLVPLDWKDASERVDEEYDLHLNNGRMLEHFHEGNLTGQGWRINYELPEFFVEVPPELAEERGIENGAQVRLTSRRGKVEVPVLITDRPRTNNLFIHVHTRTKGLNQLTGDHADDAVDTPAFKELAVKMEVLKKSGKSPLPHNNFRFGNRQPQDGILINRKWQRDDYEQPPTQAPNPERV